MQSIAILFLSLIVYSVFCSPIEQTSGEEIWTTPKFCGKLEELFQAFNQNDTGRMDAIFEDLEAINLKELNGILDANTTTSENYARDLKGYVVSVICHRERIPSIKSSNGFVLAKSNHTSWLSSRRPYSSNERRLYTSRISYTIWEKITINE